MALIYAALFGCLPMHEEIVKLLLDAGADIRGTTCKMTFVNNIGSFDNIVGIDLGTTKSCIAVMDKGRPIIIPNTEGERMTPSVIGFPGNGQLLVGSPARANAYKNPNKTIFSSKLLIGSGYEVDSGGLKYTPQDMAAIILKKLKDNAGKYLGRPVTKAVIAVPEHYTFFQRQVIRKAAETVGLEVVRMIGEAAAAALAYGLNSKSCENILVYDLGGGTFKAAVLQIGDGVFEIMATSGKNLGGDDFDRRIVSWLAAEFKKETGIDLSHDPVAMLRLKMAAEKSKIDLSCLRDVHINIPFVTIKAGNPENLENILTRAMFEELTTDLLAQTMEFVNMVFSNDTYLRQKDINRIILTGQSTRMPAVRDAVRKNFGKEPYPDNNPVESAAIGAAIQAGVINGQVKDTVLLDAIPYSLGIETKGVAFTEIIRRDTIIPTSKSRVFTTTADNQTSVDIDILAGGMPGTNDKHRLGSISLTGIGSAPQGAVSIEVKIDVDVDSTIRVSAKDLSTGKEQVQKY